MSTGLNPTSTATLVLHRDPKTLRRLQRHLEGEGHRVLAVDEPRDALRAFFDSRPHVAIVEMDDDSTELIRVLRAASDSAIVGVAPDHEATRIVLGLNAGADDVLAEDCAPIEFSARVRAALRRSARRQGIETQREVRTGSLSIDRAARRVLNHDTPVRLSSTEYRLLDVLAARVGELVPHQTLLSEVWGPEYLSDVQYLRVYIGYLRKKLEEDASRPQYLQSEWGVGYRLSKLPIVTAEHRETDEDERIVSVAVRGQEPTAA